MAGGELLRRVDAYCPDCEEVRRHAVTRDDPGSCTCETCGHVEQMMKPLGSG